MCAALCKFFTQHSALEWTCIPAHSADSCPPVNGEILGRYGDVTITGLTMSPNSPIVSHTQITHKQRIPRITPSPRHIPSPFNTEPQRLWGSRICLWTERQGRSELMQGNCQASVHSITKLLLHCLCVCTCSCYWMCVCVCTCVHMWVSACMGVVWCVPICVHACVYGAHLTPFLSLH